ncbi:hypothetical protein ABPG72_013704 [Tetrahymena utriculariae]
MKVIPEKYLRLEILKEFNDSKSLFEEIKNILNLFFNEEDWQGQVEDIQEIFKRILQEQEHVLSVSQQAVEQHRILILNNYCVLLLQLYQITKYFDLLDEPVYSQLFSCILMTSKQYCLINSASITYLLELVKETLHNSNILTFIDQESLEEFVNHICSINIEKNYQSGQLIASILYTIILKQIKLSDDINTDENVYLEEFKAIKKYKPNLELEQIFEIAVYLFNRERKNNAEYTSRWIIAKCLSKEISQNQNLVTELINFCLEILENGHRSIEDIFVLEFVYQMHRNCISQIKEVIYFLNNVLSNKKNQRHQIRDTRQIYLLLGRMIASQKQKQTDFLNTEIINNFLNSLSMKNMAQFRQDLLRLTIKFIKNNQNYQMLKKAPLSMETEIFKVSNYVVKAESTLLGLLDSSSYLAFEDKRKIVDMIHDVSIQKSDTFSQFFYEEFLNIFKSNDSQDLDIIMYCKQCLGDMYYFIVAKQFCEEEIIDLKAFDDRLSYIFQKGLERANEFHTFVLKGLVIESLQQKKDQLFCILDVFQNIIFPLSTTKYNPFSALIGFVFNSYQCFYQEEYFDLKTINNNLRLSDSVKYEEIIYKMLGNKWSMDLDIFQKKSFLIHKGLDRIYKIIMKSQAIFEHIIYIEDNELFNIQKCLKYFGKYMKCFKSFKSELFISTLRKHKQVIQDLYIQYNNIILSDMNDENDQQYSKFQQIMQIFQKIVTIDPEIKMGDQFIKIIFFNFFNQKTIQVIFKESSKQFKEGNITIYESLLYFLITVKKQSQSDKDLLKHISSQFIEFFIDNYKDMKNLISLYPGKMNLKQHQIKIIDYNIHLLSLLDIQQEFPSRKNPEEMIEVLERDIANGYFIPKQQKRIIKILEKLDKICSCKKFSVNVRSSVDNITKHKNQVYYNTCYIYYSMKMRNQMIDINTSKSDQEIFQLIIDVLENSISTPIAWGNVQFVCHQNIQIYLIMKTVVSMIVDSERFSTVVQLNRFFSLLIRAMLSPKEFSPASKISDENYLKIISAYFLIEVQSHMKSNPKKFQNDSSIQNPTIGNNILNSRSQQQSPYLTEDILVSLCILGCSDSDQIVRRCLFHKIAENTNKLPHPYLISLCLYFSDTQESLQILSSTIVRAYSERHQQFFYSLQQNEEKDYSRSLQYNIIYLFYLYMNHPLYLHQAKPSWKNLIKNMNESLDILLVNKSQYPQCFELLSSIIIRLKQATQPKQLSSLFNGISFQQLSNIKLKQSNAKILNEALNNKISSNKEFSYQDKFILLCEVALDLIVQKWTNFKKESTLKTFKLDFILPEQYYELVSLHTRNIIESMNFSKIQKPEEFYSQGSMKELSNTNFDQVSFTQLLNRQQQELQNNNAIGAQIAIIKKEVDQKDTNQSKPLKNSTQKSTITNFFSSSSKQNLTKLIPQKEQNDIKNSQETKQNKSSVQKNDVPQKKKLTSQEPNNQKNKKKVVTKN